MADRVGENISHVKLSRHRWYEDGKWFDESKPPEDSPDWSISQSYIPDQSDDNLQDEIDDNDEQ